MDGLRGWNQLLCDVQLEYHVRLTRLAARVGEQLGRDEPEAPTHSARPRKLATLSGLVDPGFRAAQKGRGLVDGPESIGGKRDWLASSFARRGRCEFQGVHRRGSLFRVPSEARRSALEGG